MVLLMTHEGICRPNMQPKSLLKERLEVLGGRLVSRQPVAVSPFLVCFNCGELPCLRSHTLLGGPHPMTEQSGEFQPTQETLTGNSCSKTSQEIGQGCIIIRLLPYLVFFSLTFKNVKHLISILFPKLCLGICFWRFSLVKGITTI